MRNINTCENWLKKKETLSAVVSLSLSRGWAISGVFFTPFPVISSSRWFLHWSSLLFVASFVLSNILIFSLFQIWADTILSHPSTISIFSPFISSLPFLASSCRNLLFYPSLSVCICFYCISHLLSDYFAAESHEGVRRCSSSREKMESRERR